VIRIPKLKLKKIEPVGKSASSLNLSGAATHMVISNSTTTGVLSTRKQHRIL